MNILLYCVYDYVISYIRLSTGKHVALDDGNVRTIIMMHLDQLESEF